MYPVLLDASGTSQIGVLHDCISALATQNTEYEYELTIEYPITGKYSTTFDVDQIIVAPYDGYQNTTQYRIYSVKKSFTGNITINARQRVIFDISKCVVFGASGSDPETAVESIMDNLVGDDGITGYALVGEDDEFTGTFSITEPRNVFNALVGMDGSLVDTFGGWLYFSERSFSYIVDSNFSPGDSGEVIRYGVNLTDFESGESSDSSYTAIVPYAMLSDGSYLTLPEKKIALSVDCPIERVVPVDLSDKFEDIDSVTESALRTKATEYIKENAEIIYSSFSVSVAGTELKEKLALRDYVTVIYPKYNVKVKKQISEMTYNVLRNRIEKITVGDTQRSLEKTLITLMRKGGYLR